MNATEIYRRIQAMKDRAPLSFAETLYQAEAFSFTPALAERLSNADGWMEHLNEPRFLATMELRNANKTMEQIFRKNKLERALPRPLQVRVREFVCHIYHSLII